MTATTGSAPPPSRRGPGVMLVRTAGSILVTGFLLGITSGRWDWGRGWAVAAFAGTAQLLVVTWVEARQPGLMGRRTRIGEGTPRWDRILVRAYLLAVYAVFVLGGLDVAWHGEGLPVWTFAVGGLVYAAGTAIAARAMAASRHFEATVRVQEDHRVVTAFPYDRIRHPGYAGGLLALPGLPLLLGAPLSFAAVGLALGLLVIRTAAEDRFLHDRLPGYRAYADRVRYRLIPGVW